MSRLAVTLLGSVLLLSGCNDSTSPRGDVTPPAAPRGVYSVTGDSEVFLSWLANTESDVAGYHVYVAPCASGADCPYDRVGSTTGTTITVDGLGNGVTRYFAVAAFDRAGNESDLSYETIHDTPRPEGFGLLLDSYLTVPASSGYDFSAGLVRPFDDPQTDLHYGTDAGRFVMIAPFTDTDLQDAGYASSLDAVDFAPAAGWSPTGTVELVPGHCYVVRISSGGLDNYAKFRVNQVDANVVSVDWAYQIDPDNRELRARPTTAPPRVRRPLPARS